MFVSSKGTLVKTRVPFPFVGFDLNNSLLCPIIQSIYAIIEYIITGIIVYLCCNEISY